MRELSASIGLTPFEMASGYVEGADRSLPASLPAVPEEPKPLAALEEAVLGPLEAGRVFVSFSGGRDSSVVLAAAARVAQRHGLAPPVPVTLRFRSAPAADETDWQQLVVEHLGLAEWEVIEVDQELDYVGPVAQRMLERHGVLYPFNAHFHEPMFEVARGGTLLTGSGGDDLFVAWRWQREAQFAAGRAVPRPRDLARLAYWAAPVPIRRRLAARSARDQAHWLSARGRQLFTEAIARDADEPRHFGTRVAWLGRRRFRALTKVSLDLLAADADARCEMPLLTPRFLASTARAGGRHGFRDRTAAMRELFAPLLPDELLARPTKANMVEVFLGTHSDEFLRSWDGTTPFPGLIDEPGLRAAWAPGENIRPRLLLQATWLAAHETR